MSFKAKCEWVDIDTADRANEKRYTDIDFKRTYARDYVYLRGSVFIYSPGVLPECGVWWPYHGRYGKGVVHVVECAGIADNNSYCLKRYYIRKFSKNGERILHGE